MRFLFFAIVCVGASASFGQTLPNNDRLSLDEQMAFILNTHKIVHQLKLSSSQLASINADFQQLGTAQQALMSKQATTDAQLDQLSHQFIGRALGVLSNPQRQRLHQLGLQIKGPFFFTNKNVATLLKLNPTQEKKISTIVSASHSRESAFESKETQKILARAKASPVEQNKILQSMQPERIALDRQNRADANKILHLLTPEQTAKWNSMLGERMP